MIKINLLPKSINEKKIVKNTAIAFGVLIVAIIAIGIAYTQMVLVPQVQAEELLATQTEALKKEVEGIESETKAIQDQTAPIKTKLTFINSVLDYNTKYPKLYEEIAKWTYEKIMLTGLTCDGTQVAMSARARSLDDLGRYLLNMYRATDLFTEVTITGVPGYPSGGTTTGMPAPEIAPGFGPQANLAGMSAVTAGVMSGPVSKYINFTVNCKLKTPITAPVFAGGAAGAAGAAGAPGAPAPAPGLEPPGGPAVGAGAPP